MQYKVLVMQNLLMKNLRFLYIADNRLYTIPESIGNCKLLLEVDLVRCGVLALPYSISKLMKLEDVYIDDRVMPFYPNPRLRFRQRITVISSGNTLYRSSQ